MGTLALAGGGFSRLRREIKLMAGTARSPRLQRTGLRPEGAIAPRCSRGEDLSARPTCPWSRPSCARGLARAKGSEIVRPPVAWLAARLARYVKAAGSRARLRRNGAEARAVGSVEGKRS